MHRRLMLEHVQPGTCDATVRHGLGQGCLVNQLAAGGVDQQRMGLKARQPFGGEQMVRLPGGRAVQGDDVHAGQHLVQIIPIGRAQLFRDHRADGLAVVIVDLHPEVPGPAGEGLADAAHADDAQPLAPQLASAHPGGGPALEPAVGDGLRALDDAAAYGEDQGHGQIGGVLGQDARGVGNDQAAPNRRVDVDMIHPGTEVGDHLQVWPCGGDQRAVNLVGNGRDQHIGPLDGGFERGPVHRLVRQVQLGVEQLAHAGFDRVRQASG